MDVVLLFFFLLVLLVSFRLAGLFRRHLFTYFVMVTWVGDVGSVTLSLGYFFSYAPSG
jgi:hypothetical protein